MATPTESAPAPAVAPVTEVGPRRVFQADPELVQELLQAERDFANGDFIEVTVEELDRCIAAGKWPWPEESSR